MNVCQLGNSRLAERQRIGSDHKRNTRCKQVLCVEPDRASLTLPLHPPVDHADCVASESRRPEATLGGPVRVPRKELRVLGQGPQGSRREPVRSPRMCRAPQAGRATVALLLFLLADPLSDSAATRRPVTRSRSRTVSPNLPRGPSDSRSRRPRRPMSPRTPTSAATRGATTPRPRSSPSPNSQSS